MPNELMTMESANLFCGADPEGGNSSNHLVLTELKLPGLDEQYVDHRAGGAPVAIEIDTIIARLECTFMLAGWTPQVAGMIRGWADVQNKFFAYGVVRDRLTGEALQARAEMWGRLGRADPQNWRRGDVQHWAYAIRGIIYYKLDLADQPIYEWDFYNNLLVINGENRNRDTNRLLFTGANDVEVGVPAPPAV